MLSPTTTAIAEMYNRRSSGPPFRSPTLATTGGRRRDGVRRRNRPPPGAGPPADEDATDGVFNLTAIHERRLPAPRAWT